MIVVSSVAWLRKTWIHTSPSPNAIAMPEILQSKESKTLNKLLELFEVVFFYHETYLITPSKNSPLHKDNQVTRNIGKYTGELRLFHDMCCSVEEYVLFCRLACQ